MKHTDAPWNIATPEVIPLTKSDKHIYSITNRSKTNAIAEIFSDCYLLNEQDLADINLIKSAPLMYALLKRLNKVFPDADIKNVIDIAEGKSLNMFDTNYIDKLCDY